MSLAPQDPPSPHLEIFFRQLGKMSDQDLKNSEPNLFGWEDFQPRDPRGRPSFAKNKENQLLVIMRRARNYSHANIAALMGCDEKTLRKYFSRELKFGSLMLEDMALQVLVKKMMEGHVPSAKFILDMSSTAVPPKQESSPKAQQPVLGKKARAAVEAKDIPEGWGDLLGQGMN